MTTAVLYTQYKNNDASVVAEGLKSATRSVLSSLYGTRVDGLFDTTEEAATLGGNIKPDAGQDVIFKVTIEAMEPATAQ